MAAFRILGERSRRGKSYREEVGACWRVERQHCGEIPFGIVCGNARRDVYGSGRRRRARPSSSAAARWTRKAKVGCQRASTSRKGNRMRPLLVHPTHIYDALRTRRRPACAILRRRCRDQRRGCRGNGGDARNAPRITACKLYVGTPPEPSVSNIGCRISAVGSLFELLMRNPKRDGLENASSSRGLLTRQGPLFSRVIVALGN